MRTIAEIMRGLSKSNLPECPAPAYSGNRPSPRALMACELMRRHSTSEGWQMQLGLENAGYTMAGARLTCNDTNTKTILDQLDPGVLVVQDKREWEGLTAGYSPSSSEWMRFKHVGELLRRDDIFKLTVLKDAHGKPSYHRESALEMGVHGWIVYYDIPTVKHVSGFVRTDHCVRTVHCIDADDIPEFRPADRRGGILISGILNKSIYPLRTEAAREHSKIPHASVLKHPGYGHTRCETPGYLQTLNRYKVALCTTSIYGYFLRKLVEATCCGCITVTDLPTDEIMPVVEENLVRVRGLSHLINVLPDLYRRYDEEKQRDLARRAIAYYNYKAVGLRLAQDIENLRSAYCG